MRSRVRSRPLTDRSYPAAYREPRSSAFRRLRAGLSNAAAIFIWSAFWGLNGYLTVVSLHDAGVWLIGGTSQPGLNTLMASIGGALISPWIAWAMHAAASLVEGFGWRDLGHRAGITFILVLMVDVGTTLRGLWIITIERGIVVTLPVLGVLLIPALVLALAPEPMIIAHLERLGLIKRKERADAD